MTWMLSDGSQESDGNWELSEPKNESLTETSTHNATPFQKMFGIEPKEHTRFKPSHPDFGKAALSGATLGLSQLIPGQQVEEGKGGGGEFIGSIPTLTGIQKSFSAPLIKFAEKSPVFSKQLKALANITGAFGTGATSSAGHDIGKGKAPSIDNMIEHGATWAAIDTVLQSLGLAGRFTKALISKSKTTAKPDWEVLNETLAKAKKNGEGVEQPAQIAVKALSILEKESPQLAKKSIQEGLQNKKFEQKIINKIDKKSPELAKPIQPESIHPNQIEKDLAETSLDNRISNIGPKSSNTMEFGQNIQQQIEQGLESAKAEYKPLYDKVNEISKSIEYTPKEMAKIANDTLQKLQSLKTKPTGYDTVIKQLENVLDDIGFILERDASGKIKNIITPIEESSNASKIIELGKRLNEIINYDVLDSTIKDRLRPLARAAKREARRALESRPDALRAFEEAEEKFAQSSEKYGKDSIRKIRKEEALEKIADSIKSPTAIKDLKNTLSPEQMARVERQILEHMRELNFSKSKEYLNEISPYLSSKTREIAQKFVRSKLPLGKEAKIRGIQEGIFDDLSESFASGIRPDKILKYWNTPKGQEIVRNGLKNNPNGKEVIKYLEKQSINDFASTIIKPDGKIDFKKLNELIKDPAIKSNLRQAGGQEAVAFFENLESLTEKMNKNVSNLEKMQFNRETTGKGVERIKQMNRKDFSTRFKIKDLYESLGIPGKTILGMIGLTNLGIPTGVGAYVGYKLLYKFATSSAARNAFKKAAGERVDPVKLMAAIEALDKDLEEK